MSNSMKENTPEATFEALKRIPLDFKFIDYSSFEMEDVCRQDYPDFSDAFIAYAEFQNGIALTDDQLEVLNEESDIVYEAAVERVYG